MAVVRACMHLATVARDLREQITALSDASKTFPVFGISRK